jgi:hypothetical protein
LVREWLQTAAVTSVLELEGRYVLRILCKYVRSDDDALTFTQKYLAKMLGARRLDRDPRCPRSAESRADPLPRARRDRGSTVQRLETASSKCYKRLLPRTHERQLAPVDEPDLSGRRARPLQQEPDGTLACVAHSTVM